MFFKRSMKKLLVELENCLTEVFLLILRELSLFWLNCFPIRDLRTILMKEI